jgi:hypothetical protein
MNKAIRMIGIDPTILITGFLGGTGSVVKTLQQENISRSNVLDF